MGKLSFTDLSIKSTSLLANQMVLVDLKSKLMYVLVPLCCRLCPEGCVFKPELLGGQEVTCLCETPLETNGEEPMSLVDLL